MNKLNLIVLFLIFLVSCKHKNSQQKSVEFVLSKSRSYERKIPLDSFSHLQKSRYDFYIIRHPPKDKFETLQLAKRHNDSLKIYNDSFIKIYDEYERVYYTESKKTPLELVVGSKNYTKNYKSGYKKDFILSCSIRYFDVPFEKYIGEYRVSYYNLYSKRKFFYSIRDSIEWR